MSTEYSKYFHANGKLLISGEYLVLKGAKAMALPLNKGQSLRIEKQNSNYLSWEATTTNGLWFSAKFDDKLNIVHSTNYEAADRLKGILLAASQLSSSIHESLKNKIIKTKLEFDPNWGWGSSSTLIANLASWLNIDAYKLLDLTFGGSGYDIACASNSRPLFFQRFENQVQVSTCNFNPLFKDQLYFVYSGKKQNSRNEIARFEKTKNYTEEIRSINEIGELMSTSQDLIEFGKLMHEHEKIIGNIVHQKPIKNEHFLDFEGYTKTLGAWGGDFFMVASTKDAAYVKEYFANKGLKTCFAFEEIALMNNKILDR